MEYGIKILMAAVVKNQPNNALPTYDELFDLGPPTELADNPSFVTQDGYGGDEVRATVDKFSSCPISLGTTEFEHAAAAKIFGITLGAQADELPFSTGDKPPYIGLAGYHDYNSTDKGDKFRGVYFPVVKMHPVGKNYTTTTTSVNLTGERAEGKAIAAKNGVWRVYSKLFDTEAEAIAWVRQKLGGT